jgi:hypothetical protein
MHLPFTHTAFLDVFGAYNRALWPAVAALWVVTVGVSMQWMRRGRLTRSLAALLAAHWAWSGIAYHWFFFRSINPAATFFAAIFLAQALLFVWLTVASRGGFSMTRSLRGILGGALVAYSIAYPLLGFAFGLHYPRLPLFAVPCPTILLTAGVLLTSSGVPRVLYTVPIVWAVIGSSAGLVLGIRADWALMPAGMLLALDALAPRALGARSSG